MPGDQTSLQRSFYEINTQVPRHALVVWWSGPLGWLPSAPRGPALLFTHQLTLTTERASTPTPLESVLKSPHRDPHEDPVLPMRGQVPPGPRPPSHLFHSQLGGEKLVGSSPAGGKGREVAFCRQGWQEAHRPRDPHTWLLQSSLGSSPPPLTGLRPSCDSWLWSHRGETRPGQPGTPQLDFPCWCWHNWLAGTGKDEGQSAASTAPGLTQFGQEFRVGPRP